MKKHNQKPYKSNPPKNHNKSISAPLSDPDLDRIAGELDTLARQRLPDRVLQGHLAGYEDEIRQDAIILALTWYLRNRADEALRVKYPWHAPRALAMALKIQKRDRLKALGKNLNMRTISMTDSKAPLHPALKRPCEWSASTMDTMVREAIRIALKRGQITHANAAIALEVLVEGVPVLEIADRLGTHRSNIYQRMNRVRRKTADIIERMEIPMIEGI